MNKKSSKRKIVAEEAKNKNEETLTLIAQEEMPQHQMLLEQPQISQQQQQIPKTTENKNDFLIEKHRYTKGRLNTRVETDAVDPPLCARFGVHFIKTLFLMYRCNENCTHASNEQIELMLQYEKTCAIYNGVTWAVNRLAMEACSMTRAEMQNASMTEMRFDSTIPKKADEITVLHDVKSIFAGQVVQRRRKKVLVPFSGGLSSMATLWWCLLKDYDIFLCYAFGALDNTKEITQKPGEIECLLRLLQYARKVDGTLLFDKSDCPESGVHALSRAEIAQRIRIVQVPQSTYYFSENDSSVITTRQPYCDNIVGSRSVKAHPQSYLLFYRQMITVAQSLDCSGIAMGMHGDAKELLTAAQPFFAKLYQHDLIAPFQTRTEALVAFQEAAEKSWQVWKSYFDQKDTVSHGVWQTAGPALMPNAAHYVSTCTAIDRLSREEILFQAQTAALERVQAMMAEEIEREQAKFDAAVARGEKIRKKRAPDPFQHAKYLEFFLEEKARLACDSGKLFHFCNNCIDCWQWREIVTAWSSTKKVQVAPQWQNLLNEYVARLHKSQPTHNFRTQEIIVSNNELSAKDLQQHEKDEDDDDEEEVLAEEENEDQQELDVDLQEEEEEEEEKEEEEATAQDDPMQQDEEPEEDDEEEDDEDDEDDVLDDEEDEEEDDGGGSDYE